MNSQDNDFKKNQVEPIFECDICEYKTSSTKGINIHKKRIHKDFKDNVQKKKSTKHKEENPIRSVKSSRILLLTGHSDGILCSSR